MKIYLPASLAISALGIFATSALSMEPILNANNASSLEGSISFNSAPKLEKLESVAKDRLDFAQNYSLDLSSETNKRSLETNTTPASDLITRTESIGQPVYHSVSTPIIKF